MSSRCRRLSPLIPLSLLLSLSLILTPVGAILSVPHFASSFFLNQTSSSLFPSASCGTDFGSDQIVPDFTAALPGADGLPISPAFYYYGGKRCNPAGTDYGAYFLLSDGADTNSLSDFAPSLVDVAERFADAAGKGSVVTASAVHITDGARNRENRKLVTIVRGESGSRFQRATGSLEPGPVTCGMWEVLGAVFTRVDEDRDVEGGDGEVLLRLRKGRMYAAVSTTEGECLFEGSTRAPEEDISQEDVIGPTQQGGSGDSGGARRAELIGAGVGGVVGVAALLVVVVGVLYWRAKRKESRADESEDDSEKDAPEESTA